jgi:hypothetical protein
VVLAGPVAVERLSEVALPDLNDFTDCERLWDAVVLAGPVAVERHSEVALPDLNDSLVFMLFAKT